MQLLYELEKIRNPILTKIFEILTIAGEEVFALALVCFIYWCCNKKLAYRIVFGLFLAGLVIQGLKITFRIPRPWIIDPGFQPVQSAIRTATGYSFPSGHTQCATCLYGTLAYSLKKTYQRAICIILMFGVAFSRMYLGVHTPKDVFVSMGITLAFVIIVSFLSKVEFAKNVKYVIAIAIALISVVLLSYSLTLYHNNIIELKNAKDSCNAAFAGIGLAIGWFVESNFINFSEQVPGWKQRILRYTLGIAVTIALKFGLGAMVGSSLIAKGLVYVVLVIWIMIGYPMIIKKVKKV